VNRPFPVLAGVKRISSIGGENDSVTVANQNSRRKLQNNRLIVGNEDDAALKGMTFCKNSNTLMPDEIGKES
jgi:hypothetical protein